MLLLLMACPKPAPTASDPALIGGEVGAITPASDEPALVAAVTWEHRPGAGSACKQMMDAPSTTRDLLDGRVSVTGPEWMRPATPSESAGAGPWERDSRMNIGPIGRPIVGYWGQEMYTLGDDLEWLKANLQERIGKGDVRVEQMADGWTAVVGRWRYDDGVLQGILAYLVDPDGLMVGVDLLLNDPPEEDRLDCEQTLEALWAGVQPGTRRMELGGSVEVAGYPVELPALWTAFPQANAPDGWWFIEVGPAEHYERRGQAMFATSSGGVWELESTETLTLMGDREFDLQSFPGEPLQRLDGCSVGEPSICFQVFTPDRDGADAFLQAFK